MSRLDKLIQELCPNGVEYKTLNYVTNFRNGKGHEKDISDNGTYIVVNSKFISTEGAVCKYSNKQIVPLYKDEILMVMSDLPNGRALAKCFIVDKNNKYTLNQRIGAFKVYSSLMNPRFLFYVLNRNKQLLRYDNGVDQTNLRKDDILKISIPVPPLEVQCEIVRILDNFTELAAELTAELTARKKQYEYYRNKLLTFDDTVPMVKLSDIATFSQGIQVDVDKQIPYQKEGYIRFLRIVDFVKDNEPPRYIMRPDNKYVKEDGDMVMIRYGASAAGKVFLQYSGAIANNMFQIKLLSNHITTKFLHAYLAQERMYNLIRGNCGTSTMPAITFGQVGAIEIPLPPLEEQERIVSILDRFDALCNDISIGLPAEIEARKKQYEYYRDKLLTFKEKTA